MRNIRSPSKSTFLSNRASEEAEGEAKGDARLLFAGVGRNSGDSNWGSRMPYHHAAVVDDDLLVSDLGVLLRHLPTALHGGAENERVR